MRSTLIITSLAAFLLMHAPAHAQSPVAEDVITRIEAEGYTVTEVTRSWLGRIVITASSKTDLREVVLNRTSGEILRDQRFPNDPHSVGAPASPRGEPGNPDGPGGPGGPGGSGGSGNGGG
jgi:hypothetical protein